MTARNGKSDSTSSPAEQVFLSMPELQERYRGVWSRWQLYEHVRAGTIPFRKYPGKRALLFPIEDLIRYENGECDLEVLKFPNGGRICRPRER
jgi:hypothetical protein